MLSVTYLLSFVLAKFVQREPRVALVRTHERTLPVRTASVQLFCLSVVAQDVDDRLQTSNTIASVDVTHDVIEWQLTRLRVCQTRKLGSASLEAT